MAVQDLDGKLESKASKESSGWLERVTYREQNADWIKKSRLIAVKILGQLRETKTSQKDLADKMGVSPQMVNKWVKGKENLTLETIVRLGAALELDFFAILAETKTKNASIGNIHFEESFNDTPMVCMSYNEEQNVYEHYQTAS